MITLLAKLFIKNNESTNSLSVRQAYGLLCAALGILLNLLLFGGKFLAGLLSNSISITADAFNNLSDASASLITLIGFKLSGQEADVNHPFGHGRIEYLAGLLVSAAIFLMGYELLLSSVQEIIHPTETSFDPLTLLILSLSILIKLYMAYYHFHLAKKINSPTIKAAATDSLSDSLTTFLVLISSLIQHLFHWSIDGYCGVLVGLLILYAGFSAAKDTINPLLGQPPGQEFVKDVQKLVLSTPGILGMHDLIVHDYGPAHLLISLHAEVSADESLLQAHEIIDQLELQLRKELNCEAVIHIDPIVMADPLVNLWKTRMETIIHSINPAFSIHDFRLTKENTHTNIIFDLVLPYHDKTSKSLLLEEIQKQVWLFDKSYQVVIQMEHAYH